VTSGTAKTGRGLEQHVANAYRRMGARKVQHDVELAGNQIDVYVELETPGHLLHRIAVEAKDWTSPVGVDIVNNFAHIVKLLHSERMIEEGVIVSASGFSRPARSAAQTYGIRLLELDDLNVMADEAKALMDAGLARIPAPPTIFHAGKLHIDTGARRIMLDNRSIPLTPTEYRLIVALAERPGRVAGYQGLFEAVWGRNVDINQAKETIKVHIYNIRTRRKLNKGYIRCVRGFGYMLAPPRDNQIG
jgi:DNA-binding winged helix-turn-helix (wHTH) protein